MGIHIPGKTVFILKQAPVLENWKHCTTATKMSQEGPDLSEHKAFCDLPVPK